MSRANPEARRGNASQSERPHNSRANDFSDGSSLDDLYNFT
jgi:hypothetical protein